MSFFFFNEKLTRVFAVHNIVQAYNWQHYQAFSHSSDMFMCLDTRIMLKRDIAAEKPRRAYFVHRFVHCPPILFLED